MTENNFHIHCLDISVFNDGQTIVVEVNPHYAISLYLMKKIEFFFCDGYFNKE